jgi:hypothetical protein
MDEVAESVTGLVIISLSLLLASIIQVVDKLGDG